MNENETIDSVITEQDLEDVAKIQYVRKNILKNIGIKKFIDIVRNAIDSSENFEFTSITKKKFINEITPIFSIKEKNFIPKAQKDLSNPSFIDKERDRLANLINTDILSHITDYMLKLIENDEELSKIYSNIEEDLQGLLWTTIFEIRADVKQNIINVRYCI